MDRKQQRKPPCFVCYVPAPVYWLAGVLEQNCFCEAFGKIGCFGHDSYEIRFKILLFGVVANVLSFLLSLVACFSLSLRFDHIVAAGFSKGLGYIEELDIPTSRIWIGLRGVAVRNFQGQGLINENYVEGDVVVPFDKFCDYIDEGLENYMDPDECDSCAEASGGLMTAVIMAALLTLPNIFTDILRMYPNYDLNCQKFFGSMINLASAALSLYTYRGYADQCFRNFYDHTLLVDVDVDVDDPTVSFLWRPGNGLVCIVLATFLKAFDIVAMLLIPAPDIAHSKVLQEEYESLYGGETEEEQQDSQNPRDELISKLPREKTNNDAKEESDEVDTC